MINNKYKTLGGVEMKTEKNEKLYRVTKPIQINSNYTIPVGMLIAIDWEHYDGAFWRTEDGFGGCPFFETKSIVEVKEWK